MSVELSFGHVLLEWLLIRKRDHDEIFASDLVDKFKNITFPLDKQLIEQNSLNNYYHLETKLWDLVDTLISQRCNLYDSMEEDCSFNTENNSIGIENGTNTIEANNDSIYNNFNKPLSKKFNSNALFTQNLILKNKQLQELQTIIEWITSNLMYSDSNLSPLDSNKWLNSKLEFQEEQTSSSMQFGAFGNSNSNKPATNVITKFDPDSTIRQSDKQLHPSDAKNDDIFFEKLYNFIINKDTANAFTICQDTNNWTHFMMLQGMFTYLDPIIDKFSNIDITNCDSEMNVTTQGIKNIQLWRLSCLSLSDYSPNLFEKCLFEYLAGGVKYNLLLNKHDWDRSLLIFVSALLNKEINEHLKSIKKMSNDENNQIVVDEVSNINSVQDILNALSDKLPIQSLNNFRVLMSGILINDISGIVDTFLNYGFNLKILQSANNGLLQYSDLADDISDLNDDLLDKDEDDEDFIELTTDQLELLLEKNPNHDAHHIYLLRVLVHLSIHLQLIRKGFYIDDYQFTSLIKLYLRRLFIKKLYELIPVYISFLPVDNNEQVIQRQCILSYYYSKLFVSKNRFIQIIEAKRYDIFDLKQILLRTVDLVIFKYGKAYGLANDEKLGIVINETEVSGNDRIFFNSIDWLIIHGGMNIDTIRYINKIFNCLLLNGKIKAILEFYSTYNFKDILKKADSEISLYMAEMESSDESSDEENASIIRSKKKLVLENYEMNRSDLLSFIKLIETGFSLIYDYNDTYGSSNDILNANTVVDKLNNPKFSSQYRSELLREEINTKYIQPLQKLIFEDLTSLKSEEVKNLYIPYFVITLHKLLINSRQFGNSSDKNNIFLKLAIRMSIKVAKEFSVFFIESNRLKEYLKLVAECCALAGEKMIYS